MLCGHGPPSTRQPGACLRSTSLIDASLALQWSWLLACSPALGLLDRGSSPLSLKQRMHLQHGCSSSSAPDLASLPCWASGSIRAQYKPCSSRYPDEPGPRGVHSRLLKGLFKAPYATFRVLNPLSRGCSHSEPLGKGPARDSR